MSQGVIYSSQLRFYVERVIAGNRKRDYPEQRSAGELIESFLRQHGVIVIDDLDKGSPVR